MLTSPRRRTVMALLLAVSSACLALSGCSRQGEGERCDRRANGNGDCDDGLVCKEINACEGLDRCCPPDGEAIGNDRCIAVVTMLCGGTGGTSGTAGTSGESGASGETNGGTDGGGTSGGAGMDGGGTSGGAGMDAGTSGGGTDGGMDGGGTSGGGTDGGMDGGGSAGETDPASGAGGS